jgi:hypothetical protein
VEHRTHQRNGSTLTWPKGTIFKDYDRHVSKPTACQASVNVPGLPELFFAYDLFERLTPEQVEKCLWGLYKSSIETSEIQEQHLQKGYW